MHQEAPHMKKFLCVMICILLCLLNSAFSAMSEV